MEQKLNFKQGILHGLPICFAYIAVSFTFGLTAVNKGLSVLETTLISATNLTSAGQFAGIQIILAMSSLFEIFLAVFIINSRYMLMSISISQQLTSKVGTLQRLLMSCFVTDEIFAVASIAKNKLTVPYFLGLSLTPYLGWTLGTFLGAIINSALPVALQNAMGIALYCMFIAIIIPPAKDSLPITMCVIIGALLSCTLEYTPVLNKIPFGFKIIISAVVTCIIVSLIFPIPTENAQIEESADD